VLRGLNALGRLMWGVFVRYQGGEIARLVDFARGKDS